MKRKWITIVLILLIAASSVGLIISYNQPVSIQVRLNTSGFTAAEAPETTVSVESTTGVSDPIETTTEENETTTAYIPETTVCSETVPEEHITHFEDPTKPASERKYTIGCVAARRSPDLCSLPALIIRGGEPVEKIGSEGLFTKILYNGEIYYVCSARIGDIGIGLVSIFDLL